MKKKYFFVLFILSIIFYFYSCGSYDLQDSVQGNTYVKGRVSLEHDFFLEQNTNIAGAEVYINYAGQRHLTYTNIQGEFLLNLPLELNKKDNYIIRTEKNNIILYAFVETDRFGDVEFVKINEESTINYYIINRFMEKFRKYGLTKTNIVPQTFLDYLPSRQLIVKYMLNEEVYTHNLKTDEMFLYFIEETSNNYNKVIATIPYESQTDFYYKSPVKIFFGTTIDTSVSWLEVISFDKEKISEMPLTGKWNDAGNVLTISLLEGDNYYIDKHTIYVNNGFKTISNESVEPFSFSFSAISEKPVKLTDYFNLEDYVEYRYRHTFPSNKIQTHFKIDIDTMLNGRRVYNIGENNDNYSVYSNDEEGLLLHRLVKNGVERTFNLPVKLASHISYKGNKWTTENNEGVFISEITSVDRFLEIKLLYRWQNQEEFETKIFRFEKNRGKTAVRELGYYDMSLVDYRNSFNIIKPLKNAFVPLNNNRLEIEWTSASDTGFYQVKLSKNQNFFAGDLIFSDTTTNTGITVNNISDTGKVYIRVEYYNDTFFEVDYCSVILFNYNYLSNNRTHNAISGRKYEKVIKDRFIETEESLYYYILNSPADMIISPLEGKITWEPENHQKGLYNISIGLSDTATLNFYKYDYQLYIIPSMLINVFKNDDGETLTFFDNNTFKKVVENDTVYTGMYSVFKDTIVFNYYPDTYTPYTDLYSETGVNLYYGRDTISYRVNNREIIYRLIDPDTRDIVDPDKPSQPLIISVPKTSAVVNSPYAYWVKAQPANWGQLSYEIIQGPKGMTISSNGVVYWVPDHAFANQTIQVAVRVYEAGGGFATQTFSIFISP